MERKTSYWDNAATMKPKKEVVDAMLPYLYDKWYNPSSLYNPSKSVKEDIENVRKIIAKEINANPEEIYFTSGGSESNCWAIQGYKNKHLMSDIITTQIEHKSIMNCVNGFFKSDVSKVDVNKYGEINLKQLESLLQNKQDWNNDCYDLFDTEIQTLVSIQFANNEIGTIQDMKTISELVHKYNGVLHTDAVQAFGHVPIDVKEMGIDMLSASGHKLGCPKGIGFLYIRNGIEIEPLIYGSQERGMRGGTENVPYIIGLGKAVELIDYNHKDMNEKRKFLEQKLIEMGCKINGLSERKLSNNINVTFSKNNITGEALIYLLDTCNIYISSGSACNSHSQNPSYVLQAIGLSDEEIYKTIRITLPDDITYEQLTDNSKTIKQQIKIMESI